MNDNKDTRKLKDHIWSQSNPGIPVYGRGKRKFGVGFFQITYKNTTKTVMTRVKILFTYKGEKAWMEIPASIIEEVYFQRNKPQYPQIRKRKESNFRYIAR